MRSTSLCLLFLLASCERVIDLNVDEGPRRLVVEARLERVIEHVSSIQSVKLSVSSSYFSNSPPIPARAALVRVVDDRGVVTPFTESNTPGAYVTSSLTVTRDRTYTLLIDWEGGRYEAKESTRAVAPIDSLYFEKPQPGRFAGDKGVRATIDFVDRGGEHNYFLWDQYVNGKRQLGPDSTVRMRITATDDGYDGLPIRGLQPFEGVDIPIGADVLMRQYAISADVYRYYFALSDQLGADGSPFSVPSSSLRGNVANRSKPNLPAAGYFYVSEVSEARARYQP